jgi:hypothetical protein
MCGQASGGGATLSFALGSGGSGTFANPDLNSAVQKPGLTQEHSTLMEFTLVKKSESVLGKTRTPEPLDRESEKKS